jgi:integrase
LRFYESVLQDGQVVRKKSFRILAPVSKDYPNKTSVTSLADKILAPLNSGTLVPESSQHLVDFIDNHYLPEAKKILRPSTYKGYKDIVELHLRKRLGDVRVRDFRTVHGQRLMTQIPNVGHKTLLRIRATLSAVFTHALRTGVLDGHNPMHAVSVPGRPKKYVAPSYSIEESVHMSLAVVSKSKVAFVAVSIAAFTGLRVSELRGLRWADFDGEFLNVSRAVWRTHVGQTKTEESEAPVPVIDALKYVLTKYREEIKPKDDDYILAGERRGAPLNLHNLANRFIKPAIQKYNAEEDRKPEEVLKWKGWKAWRTGLGNALAATNTPPKILQAILRHTSPTTSFQFYVTVDQKEAVRALNPIQELVSALDEPEEGA